MESIRKQKIISVDPRSPAESAGISAGEYLLRINGEPVLDLVDYEYLSASADPVLELCGADGNTRTVTVRKDEIESIGLNFETSLMSGIRSCANRCMFCFVDQMPDGMRPSLSFKDDDWRLSFIMGNYVTLTNLSDTEFERILKRRVSPLYISVHATSPEVRERMMHNRNAGKLMDRLTRLAEAGLYFHTQVVLCPGENDGDVLLRTLEDLKSLYPYCGSVAVVPVGLTKFREGLCPIRAYTPQEAMDMIMQITDVREICMRQIGTGFVFLSDEWYLLAGVPLPGYDEYESFEQIENGVGLLRLFEADFNCALEDAEPRKIPLHVSVAGGTACHPFFKKLYRKLEPYHVTTDLYPIRNDFFGGNVSVAGLVTGRDLVEQLTGRLRTEVLLIPSNMLREKERVFLDDMTVEDLERALSVRVIPFASGDELVDLLMGEEL